MVGGGYIGLGGFIKQSLLIQHIAVVTVIHKFKDVPFFGYFNT
jgi:hypothetical protein